MKFIVENWFVIVAIAAVGGSIGYAIYSFVKMPSDKQLNKVREWLLYAVTKAEKELGAGTGKLKLRYVYDMFVARFEWLAKVITFDMFSMMVDEALEQMRTMLDSNEAVQKLIANEAGEGSEYFNPRSREGSDSNFRQKIFFSLSKNCLIHLFFIINFLN